MSRPADLSTIKVGSYLIIEGEPCRVVEYDKSKPGKHGSAKARVTGIGIFDSVKRVMVSPVSAMIQIPIVEKKTAQVISLLPDAVQLMDLENFEIFETPMPDDQGIKEKLSSGMEVELWRILGKNKISRVKG